MSYEDIIKNIDCVIGEDYIRDVLINRNLKIYWGTTPSALPNINYLIPIVQIANFIMNNCEIKILLADIHAYLDSSKPDIDIINIRTNIHETIIKLLFNFLNININSISFIQGSLFQLKPEYTMDVYKFNSLCKVSQVKYAGEQAVKQQSYDPLMTSLLYPTLQALDIEHLECDVFFGDINQENICHLGNDVLDKLGYQTKGYFLNELNDNLKKIEKISFLDNINDITRKINNLELDILIDLIDMIILPINKIKTTKFIIKDNEFDSPVTIIEFFKNEIINLEDIKSSIIFFFDNLNKPIREEFSYDISIKLLKDAKY